MKKIAVVGGGITGLAAAHRLNELCPDIHVDLFESSPDTGGVLKTEGVQDFLVEHSADMFTSHHKAALNLCDRIGFTDQLVGTNPKNQRAFIAQGSNLVPVPRGLNLMTPSDLASIQTTPLLSDEGKKRFLQEEIIPPKPRTDDESLESFAVRRFGVEAYEKLIQPLVGGIYTADPKKLSLQSTLNQYLEMESHHGSIIAAAKSQQQRSTENENRENGSLQTSGARYNLFLAPKAGMSSLIEAVRQRMTYTSILLGNRVNTVKQRHSAWQLQLENGTQADYSAVILTCPAKQAADLIGHQFQDLAAQLGSITYASSAIVIHGFEKKQINHPLDGFGFVVPLVENRNILASSFSSVKFPGRANDQNVLLRTFVGGGCQPELLDRSNPEIAQLVQDELQDLLGTRGTPKYETIIRWNHSMPQYHVGHLDWVRQLESDLEAIEGLEVAGKSYRGVGIPACVESGELAAARIAQLIG
ncbi:MAG: protoporphyrinogen oxidase [Planctomycetota bacterium]|nr:protoporphyrinogen oxidase [Planctomycetota bacterium]